MEVVYYTDGHDVAVTSSALKVGDNQYPLSGISRHGIHTLRPRRVPGLIIFAIGSVGGIMNRFQMVPPKYGYSLLAVAVALLTTGMLMILLAKPRYAVRIKTFTGEIDVITSNHQNYIIQIIQAINSAYKAKHKYVG